MVHTSSTLAVYLSQPPLVLLHDAHDPAGLPAKAKSASWTLHSTKPAAAKHGYKSRMAAATPPAAATPTPHYTAAALAAGPAAAAAAAARKGKAKLASSKGGLNPGGALPNGLIAEDHRREDEQAAAMLVPQSRLRSKVEKLPRSP